jgi:hypothetical protein
VLAMALASAWRGALIGLGHAGLSFLRALYVPPPDARHANGRGPRERATGCGSQAGRGATRSGTHQIPKKMCGHRRGDLIEPAPFGPDQPMRNIPAGRLRYAARADLAVRALR